MDMSASRVMPVATAEGASVLQRFLDRDLAALQVVVRLQDAADHARTPLLQRLRLLATAAGELDAFYRARIACLRRLVRTGEGTADRDRLTPAEQLQRIAPLALDLAERQKRQWRRLQAELAAAGVHVVEPANLNADERAHLAAAFERDLLPLLTPVAIDADQALCRSLTSGLSLAVVLVGGKIAGHPGHVLLPIPSLLARFLRLPTAGEAPDERGEMRFIRIEAVLRLFIDQLFPGFVVRECDVMRTLHSDAAACGTAEEVPNPWLPMTAETCPGGETVRLAIGTDLSAEQRRFFADRMQFDPLNLEEHDHVTSLADLGPLIAALRPNLQYPRVAPLVPEVVRQHGGVLFDAIRETDFVALHPQETVDVVAALLRQTADNPHVLSIKCVFGAARPADSLIAALREAALAGKLVTVVVEPEVRSGGRRNGAWAHDLQQAGALVLRSGEGMCPPVMLTQIVRHEEAGLRTYVYLGTGGCDADSAGNAADLSYFTATPAIVRDTVRFFNVLTGLGQLSDRETLAMSASTLRERVLDHIREERYHARAGRPAAIRMRLNALSDEAIIDALYEASAAGVAIELDIAGVCRLLPGVEGLSDNIRASSGLGRLRDSVRVLCFGAGNGLPADNANVYIATADLTSEAGQRPVLLVPVDSVLARRRLQERIGRADDDKSR